MGKLEPTDVQVDLDALDRDVREQFGGQDAGVIREPLDRMLRSRGVELTVVQLEDYSDAVSTGTPYRFLPIS
jgi:hypothetical protein